jgi:hypothetical protein
VVHGAAPNNSDRLRMAQFIKAFRQGLADIACHVIDTHF